MRKAPRPTNVTELQSFLGLVQCYAKFIANMSTMLHPSTHFFKQVASGHEMLNVMQHSHSARVFYPVTLFSCTSTIANS